MRTYSMLIRETLTSPVVAIVTSTLGILLSYTFAGVTGAMLSATVILSAALLVSSATFLLLSVRSTHREGSPWTVDEATYDWYIHDVDGRRATFIRTTHGICEAQAVSVIEEIFSSDWDGLDEASIHHSGGTVVSVRRMGDRVHVVIVLDKVFNYGDQYSFTLERKLHDAFIADTEWVAVNVDKTSLGPIHMAVHVPYGSQLLFAWFESNSGDTLSSSGLLEGTDIKKVVDNTKSASQIIIAKTISRPKLGDTYSIRWKWAVDGGGARPAIGVS